jgi:hypothetical protein
MGGKRQMAGMLVGGVVLRVFFLLKFLGFVMPRAA